MGKQVTRNDVAKRAGVSTAVVSYVMNNGPQPVAPRTRERVLAAVEDVGYRVNHIARSLRLQRTFTLGIIIFDSANAYFSEVVKGIEDEAYNLGYSILVSNTNNNLERRRVCINIFISRKVDGIILIGTTLASEDMDLLNQYQIQTMYIGSEGELEPQVQESINTIFFATEKGGYKVGIHLLERGYRQLACIVGRQQSYPSAEVNWFRLEGFSRALSEAGMKPQVVWEGETLQDGYRATLRLVDGENPPDAIFACNDLVAIGVLRAAADRGLSVPDDLAVCGFDDIEYASYVNPRLTTIHIPKHEIGEKAAKIIINRIQAQSKKIGEGQTPDPVEIHQCNTTLIIREST